MKKCMYLLIGILLAGCVTGCTTVSYTNKEGTTVKYSKFGTTANIAASISKDTGNVTVSNQQMIDVSSFMQAVKAAATVK